ncbi:ribonuclease Z [Enterococcus columbae]|uniref:Ribonuclease Z n=1 Tax=Enterococcus columbae DSM 7374 = ATCC 51263 TaxID=1121865 RepID=S1NUN0_9ENTE|nr:ribonuclease Z [Enterococcus columbae]EOT44466.1 ribonuclease Z [Enterococcus columbae DSM 7374 = ATCC 51263]EOW84624.1 ribonuclease Z [Enterococcus columbae DSM 7374 = ATCC 51263]OJG23511.1 ribonuclease Z [Enterococcus columbae DSM 7374 = ATCC 51263]
MELEFLGTGAGVPAKHRTVSSIALKLLDERNAVWLFDCGEGTQMQILKSNLRPRKIEKIFITHLHGDHIFGLPGLLSSRSFQGGDEKLEVYGPNGIEEYIKTSLRISKTRLAYPIEYIEVKDNQVVFDDGQFKVEAKKLDHGIESFGYRITEADRAGELQVEKLKALGILPGPVYGQIKNGGQVTLPDGRIINGADFVGEAHKGRIITILGDTRYHQHSIELAKNADVLVHESTFNKNEGKLAKAYFHSTTHQAAQVAKKAGVKQLILTHISSRYLNSDLNQLADEAREIFPNTLVAKDLWSFDIPLKKGNDKNEA